MSSEPSSQSSTKASTAKHFACTTNDCKVLEQWLRVKMDHTVDPCRDFYQFVCDDYKGPYLTYKRTLEIARIAKSAARATTVPATGQTAWQKAVALFQACLTMVNSKRYETKDLIAWMTSLGLDLNNLTHSDQFDPLDMVVRLSLDFGVPVFVEVTFDGMFLVNNKRLLILKLNDADAHSFLYQINGGSSDMKSIWMVLNKYDVHISRINGLYEEIKKYESQLISLLTSILITKGATDIISGPIEDMGEVTQPVISGEMWAGSIAKYTNGLYQGSDMMRCHKLTLLFLSNSLKSKDVGSNGMRCYIAWSLFRQMVNYTDPDFLAKDKNPEDICYKHVNRVMGYAISSRFFHSVISKKTFIEVNEMASNIRKAYQAAFRSSTWMTGSVKETALRKITNMRPHIGALGGLLDAAYVEKYYASIPDLPTDRFFKSWREAAAASIHQASADSTMLLNLQTQMNAFYVPEFNRLFVLPSILLLNTLFTDGPAAFNYGSLGTIISHEMMHGYDVDGSRYDENAKLRRWLSPESTEHYVNTTLCLRDIHVDVLRRSQEVLNDTIDSENLADLGGTTMAYSAFRSLPPSKRDTTLPGVTMTANQLFFVGYCTKWCEEQTTEPPPWLSGRRPYAPRRSRCIVPLMNMPEFSDAFNCKLGSYMNPPNKCNFWT
ncbi:neprilysin-1-like isoform X2 [Dermacentor albipictus]|uniref:neprilysin-1-like isoform X2 n=1 Tax=Dermacentor albipictus TaxID=60249 RepID=UPI0031FC9A47